MVAKNLTNWGYQVQEVKDFQTILKLIDDFQPHLIILDISLPFFNGYYWCQEIRKTSRVPIMFLSSHDQPMDIVMAINMGADDFVTKPFEMTVLLAKIQGLLRRTYDFVGEQSLLWFEQINQQGQTILMVTHSTAAASRAKRVLFIKDGILYNQIYRGERTSQEMFQLISDTLTLMANRGE